VPEVVRLSSAGIGRSSVSAKGPLCLTGPIEAYFPSQIEAVELGMRRASRSRSATSGRCGEKPPKPAISALRVLLNGMTKRRVPEGPWQSAGFPRGPRRTDRAADVRAICATSRPWVMRFR